MLAGFTVKALPESGSKESRAEPLAAQWQALLFRTKSRKDNPEGRSILRNAYRPWYFKELPGTNGWLAKEVLRGDWGNGADRKKRLEAAGYNYAQVQAAVNRLC